MTLKEKVELLEKENKELHNALNSACMDIYTYTYKLADDEKLYKKYWHKDWDLLGASELKNSYLEKPYLWSSDDKQDEIFDKLSSSIYSDALDDVCGNLLGLAKQLGYTELVLEDENKVKYAFELNSEGCEKMEIFFITKHCKFWNELCSKEHIEKVIDEVRKTIKEEKTGSLSVKALDKACECIVKATNKIPYCYLPIETKEEWKDYLLSEVSK